MQTILSNKIKAKVTIFIICFLLLLTGLTIAQPKPLDSLKLILKNTGNFERVKVLNKIAESSIYCNDNEIIQYAEEALVLSKQLQFKEGEAEVLYNLSYGYYLKNKVDSLFIII